MGRKGGESSETLRFKGERSHIPALKFRRQCWLVIPDTYQTG
jgi:hypothetical protein